MTAARRAPRPARAGSRVRLVAVAAGLVALAVLGVRSLTGGVRFDPEAVGAAETRMWRAYYAKNPLELGRELLALQQRQFGLSLPVALAIAEPFARAAGTFSSIREDYDRVLPDLVAGYDKLRSAVGGRYDPAAAARAELAWWVARRTPGEDSPETVGARIADLYATLYGARNERIDRAGLLRAQAAEQRDQEAERGTPDWAAIERLLVESYTELRAGASG